MALRPSYEELVAENETQRLTISSQAELIAELQRKVAELEKRLGKSSQNSSMPPSSDSPGKRAEATRTRAERRAQEKRERKAEARRRGKQPGAPGENLPAKDVPDHVVPHEPDCCSSCGGDLFSAPVDHVSTRQVFDTPEPRLICTEHRSIAKRCRCGTVTAKDFPPEARAPTCYGPNVRAQALYMLRAQHLSVERTAEAMTEMLGAEVSTGFVASLVPEASGLLRHSGFMERLRQLLHDVDVIYVDETPTQVRTDKWYFHVAATNLYTYLFASSTRAKSAPDQAGVLSHFRGVMMHDRLSMYFKYRGAQHAVCGAHLVRDLASVAVAYSQTGWAEAMSALLVEMNEACHLARSEGRKRLGRRQLAAFLSRYDAIIEDGLAANPAPEHRKRDKVERESSNLVVALEKLKPEVTRFAKDLRVGMTNNEAERSLRTVKLHKKISGCFQADRHAESFADIRSYIGTARKHGVGALFALASMFRHDTWMPPTTT